MASNLSLATEKSVKTFSDLKRFLTHFLRFS
jgi:hypothetical protein